MKIKTSPHYPDRLKLNIFDLLKLAIGAELEICGLRIRGHFMPKPYPLNDTCARHYLQKGSMVVPLLPSFSPYLTCRKCKPWHVALHAGLWLLVTSAIVMGLFWLAALGPMFGE